MTKQSPRPEGINLGQLQAEFIAARKAAKSAASAHERAQVAHDNARAVLERARERLAAASRAVLS